MNLSGDTNSIFDCIVIGFGGVGSAAMRAAALNRWSVLGIDRFGPAHDRGSSHGQTRIIRRAYFEHPNYVPLANRAFEMWDELNKRHRTSPQIKELITTIGLLQIGNPDSDLIQGVKRSADQHSLAVEQFTSEEIRRRLPILKVPADQVGLFEPDAAFLRVEMCVTAMIDQAVKHGAQIMSNTEAQGWSVSGDGICHVSTDKGNFQSRHLIIAAGAWNPELLPDLDLGLQVVQKQQHWFQLDRVDHKIENQFPGFLVERDNGDCFYGIPEINYLGLKVCEHSGGKLISGPQELDAGLNQLALQRNEEFMQEYLEHGRRRLVHHSNCMYTTSPDGHFFVDNYPGHSNVVFAAGLSGHGFKFTPVLGKHLVSLLHDHCEPEFEFFKLEGRV